MSDTSPNSADSSPPADLDTAQLEEQLLALWQDVLKVRQVSLDDDFFEIGGDSLTAAKVLDRLYDSDELDLPISIISEYPTVRTLAAAIGQEGGVGPAPKTVVFRADGDRPTFFCVPGAGAVVDGLKYVAKHIGDEQPFVAFQHRGMDGHEQPHSTIEAVAAEFVSEMRRLQPDGPYFLGGSSYGGVVAFEMAHQLEADGQEVAVLVMFDSYAPGYPQHKLKEAPKKKLLRYLYHFFSPAGEHGDMVWRRMKNAVRQRYYRTTSRVVNRYCERTGKPLPKRYRFFRGLNAAHRAMRQYELRPYGGRFVMLRSEEQPPAEFYVVDPTLGWGPYTTRGLETYDIPGRHGEQIKEPTVIDVCRIIREVITDALGHVAES